MTETQTATDTLQDASPCPPEGAGAAKDSDRGKVVVSLPEDTGAQWTLLARTKSGGWRLVAHHIDRNAMIRQLSERLWGARGSCRQLRNQVKLTLFSY